MITRIKDTSAAPIGDTATTNLFSTANLAGYSQLPGHGMTTFTVDIASTAGGSLKPYKRISGGSWIQMGEFIVGTPDGATTYKRDFDITGYDDWKLDWVNGGTAQSIWAVDMSLSDKFPTVYPENYKYWTNAVMSGALTGDWIDCQDKTLLSIGLEWASTPSGNFVLETSNDPARTTDIVKVTVPTSALHYTLSAGTIAMVDGTGLNEEITLTGATGTMRLQFTDLPKWARLKWTRTGSGSSTLDAWVNVK
jgi:hypothetical protein